MRTRTAVVAFVARIVPAVSMADPSPPGTCTALDNGVAGGVLADSPSTANPHSIVMNVPQAGPITGNSDVIIDLAFLIKSDGTVSGTKVLCSNIEIRPYDNLLLAAAPKWRFTPMIRNGKAIDSMAAFRLFVGAQRATPLPLVFVPQD